MPTCEKCGTCQPRLLTKHIEFIGDPIFEMCILPEPLKSLETINLCYRCFHRNVSLSREIVENVMETIKNDKILLNFDEYKEHELRRKLHQLLFEALE